ncbi:MAG: Spy/CpxP family protein refolding chaperone [Thermodesulfobacteriota bacterium]
MQLQKTVSIALALVMVFAATALAAHHGKRDCMKGKRGTMGADGPGKAGPCPMAMLHGLDLSESQVDQVADVFNRYEDEHDDLRKQMREAREALREAVHGDGFNEEEIRGAARTVGDGIADMAVHRARIFSEIRPVLTADQIEKLETMKTKRLEQRKCHRRLNKAFRNYRQTEE